MSARAVRGFETGRITEPVDADAVLETLERILTGVGFAASPRLGITCELSVAARNGAGILTGRLHCGANASAVSGAVPIIVAHVGLDADTPLAALSTPAIGVVLTRVDALARLAQAICRAIIVIDATERFEATASIAVACLVARAVIGPRAGRRADIVDADAVAALVIAHARTLVGTRLGGDIAGEHVGAVGIADASIAAHALFADPRAQTVAVRLANIGFDAVRTNTDLVALAFAGGIDAGGGVDDGVEAGPRHVFDGRVHGR